jgi:hypothetical protein
MFKYHIEVKTEYNRKWRIIASLMIKKISQLLGNLGLIAILALLGALAGQRWKWLRRFVFPAIITLYALSVVHNWYILTIYCMSGVLSIGYGRWDINDDKVSFLGTIAHKIFPQSPKLQDVMIRGIIGKLIALSMLSVPIIQHTYLSYLLGSWVIILVWAFVSHRGFGEIPIKLFGRTYNMLKVDLVTYGVTSLGLIIIINGFLG